MDASKAFIFALLFTLASASNEHCICASSVNEDSLQSSSVDGWWMECFDQEDCEQIVLLDENYTLQESLNISNRSNVAISGASSITILICTEGTGITFTSMTNLSISNIALRRCGQLHIAEELSFKAAILITESINLSMSNTEIMESNGEGLAMLNVAGNIEISNCSFKWNRVDSVSDYSGGGGVYLELALPHNRTAHIRDKIDYSKQDCKEAEYHFTNCTITDNNATAVDPTLDCDNGLFTGIGHGGAMSLRLQNYPCDVKISVDDSILSRNSAEWGGAIELVACRAKNNHIAVNNTRILNNDGRSKGGGGVDIAFSGQGTQGNTVVISSTVFAENSALYGGGVLISTHYAYDQRNNSVNFEKCSWINNSAHYASAVDIFPAGILDSWKTKPEVSFRHCTFKSNYNRNSDITADIHRLGEGVVMITGFIVDFEGEITFYGNNGSSIYAISSLLKFNSNVTALFHSNVAEVGAGIALIGSSAIAVGSCSNITFSNNNATRLGAAIYYCSVDKHIYVHGKRCFIQKLDESVSGATFNFIENSAPKELLFPRGADYVASSIYISTNLKVCCINETSCDFDDVGEFNFFSKSANNTDPLQDGFGKISNYSQHIIEGEVNFALNFTTKQTQQDDFLVTPGFSTTLPLIGNKNTTFDVTINKSINSQITVAHSYETIHNNKLKVTGQSGETATLTLTERSNRRYYFKLGIKLEQCPPLFKLSDDLFCICYSSKDMYHLGSFRCEEHNASIHVSYWVGYAEKDTSTLLISFCPSYCGDPKQGEYYYNLPKNPLEMEATVCDSNRHGMLCGECRENHAVYFYARSFKCKRMEHCKWGPLHYLVSELLPVTILFLVVILFNISFTSGGINGFIFFAQMYDTIVDLDVGQSYIIRDSKLRRLRILPHMFYQFFNLIYFGFDEMSFCLWENANTLGILAFKYLTVVYALVLVMGTILAIRLCSAYGCIRLRKLKYSVIQGLSAFLVMAYSQCTEVSFSILNAVIVYNGTNKSSTVVFLQGSIGYFSRQHLPFALPALLCIMVFVSVLPLLLLSYPLCNKVIAFLKLEDKCLTRHIIQLFPSMSRIKPFLDCFQGTFKDNRRFFAGLYFVYRVAILGSRFAPTVLVIYAIMEFQLVVMLVLHVVFWPYQRKIHNIVDTLLLANLAIITILNMLINIEAEMINIFVIYLIELAFVSIPLVALFIYCVYRIVQRMKSRLGRKEDHRCDVRILDAPFLEDNVRKSSLSSDTDSYMLLMRERKEN